MEQVKGGDYSRPNNGSPKMAMSRSLELVNVLYGKRNFAHVIKLKTLRWRNYLGLLGWAHCSYKHLYEREAGELESERKDWKTLCCWP